MHLRQDDLSVKVDVRHHALSVDDELVLVAAEVFVLLEEFLCLYEIGMAGHDQDLTLEVFPLQDLGAVSHQLRANEALDHHLIHCLVGRQTHLAHSHRVLFGCLLEHNRGASVEHQAHLTIADELVSFIDQSLVSRSRSNNANGN